MAAESGVASRGRPKLAAAALMLVAAGVTLAAFRGCDESSAGDAAVVRIAGQAFHLELALDDAKRIQGLSGRTHIDRDGGMLFAFAAPRTMYFVMRDCPIPIDILFLDPRGVVIAAHAMQPEEPRRADEPKPADPRAVADPYEERLRKYGSNFSAQFAVELAGGRIKELGVKEGDRLSFDVDGLKRRAK
ncbi:MAG: DUF192 domain-containing protein [Phycisphaerales bacterium]